MYMRSTTFRHSTTSINNTVFLSIPQLCPSCHEHGGNLFDILVRIVNVRLKKAHNSCFHCSLINS